MKSLSFTALPLSRASRAPTPRQQRGIILAVTMIVLVIMLVAGIALVRSFTSSVGVAGNLAFRRDLTNQGEQAAYVVYQAFYSGAMNNLSRQTNQANYNYSACELPVDVHGVPVLLGDDPNFGTTVDLSTIWKDPHCNAAGVALASNDIGPDANGVTVRYVVDRLCSATGAPTIQTCSTTPPQGTQTTQQYHDVANQALSQTPVPVYRMSIRSVDPRGSQTFMQVTFSN